MFKRLEEKMLYDLTRMSNDILNSRDTRKMVNEKWEMINEEQEMTQEKWRKIRLEIFEYQMTKK